MPVTDDPGRARPTNRRSIAARLAGGWRVLSCLLLCVVPGQSVLAASAQPKIECQYTRWVKQYEGTSIRPNEQDPLFLDFLRQPDGDLFFLRGLGAAQEQVRSLSRLALGRLKTDRTFNALAKLTNGKDLSVRERAVQALGDFRQSRCVPFLLITLEGDREAAVRRAAADALANFPEKEIEAVLRQFFKANGQGGYLTVRALGIHQVVSAIEPTYQLLLATKDGRLQNGILEALCLHRRKRVVRYLLDLQDHPVASDPDPLWNKRMLADIQGSLQQYAAKTHSKTGPVPEIPEQWREWWAIAEPMFSDDMQLLATTEPAEPPVDKLGSDAEQLKFSIALDAKTYRVGDPIAVDFSLENKSDLPMRTIPPVTSGWWQTMAYGIHLARRGDPDEILIEMEPTDFYVGSYSGPPRFQTLRIGETLNRRDCLHDWLDWMYRRHPPKWPLTPGSYRLSIVFDNAQFAAVRPKPGEIVHRWEAPPIEFVVEGPPRTDTQELLKLIAEKSKNKWLDTDMDSENWERKNPAWHAIRTWGDDRLTPVLRDRKRYREYVPIRGPLPHFEFSDPKLPQ